MEIVLLILLIFIIILLVNSRKDLLSEIKILSRKVDGLKAELDRMTKLQSQEKIPAAKDIHPEPKVVPEPDTSRTVAPAVREEAKPAPVTVLSGQKKPPVTKPKEKQPSFFERHPDMEKFIGENLINKIGIAILVLGIGFFVKYAIDQEWINKIGRVFIGILCGGILTGLAHKLRRNYKAFSSVLVGGGMAVFYLTIAIAFHEYQLLSQIQAFIVMVLITGFSVLLSIAYDRMELAVLAIIGGFASPFMVSTGEGNYIVLFTYVLILNKGMLILAYFKKWNLVNIISYAFTVILFGGWLIGKYNPEIHTGGALIFATLFYFIFFLMNIVNNIRENRKFSVPEISILLSNTFLYYTAGMVILTSIRDGYFNGLFTALIAVFNFAFAYALYRNRKADTTLVYLLIGLVLTFLSLAAPVQLKGNNITLFWSAETVLLLWLSQKSGIRLIRLASVIVMALMAVSLAMDWKNIYGGDMQLPLLFNKGFVTGIVSLVSLFLTLRLLKREEDMLFDSFPKAWYQAIITGAFILFLYITGILELSYQLHACHIDPESFRTIILGSYNLAFIFGLMFIRTSTRSARSATVLAGMTAGLLFMAYYHWSVIDLRGQYILLHTASSGKFMYHYLLPALTVASTFLALQKLVALEGMKSPQARLFLWYLTLVVVFVASAELDHLLFLFRYEPSLTPDMILDSNHKVGFPILWGLCSLVLMVIGMNNKIKELRIISLSLFTITLVKLFAFDLRHIPTGGKIAAFICLGILLLVVSFMYQKLKKLVLDDESRPSAEIV